MALALQGGGSHGAFTWGVLDRLLEDERIEIEGMSGASAGAMNAVVLAHGCTVGGREGARQALKDFWESVASKASFTVAPESFPEPVAAGLQHAAAPALNSLLSLTRFFSPHQLNPLDLNPLRDILASQVDFERLRANCRIELFIATTQVSTGLLRLFRTRQLTLEVLLASACLPALHRAVYIDGEAYWDGGLTANPPIFPLVHRCAARDVIVVLLQPSRRPEVPTGAGDIWRRLSEIGLSSTFFTELQGLALAKREAGRALVPIGRLHRRLRQLRMHSIDTQELTSRLSPISKFRADPQFIHALRNAGRMRADAWLNQNFDLIGVRSSFRLDRFLHWRAAGPRWFSAHPRTPA